MSTWFPDIEHSWLERLVIRILRKGVIPKHIAFIMDGNRRYAKNMNQERMIGHSRGFEKLAQTLSWCRDLGITQATLYAFSIENFKRPKEEVDYLMNLFRRQANKVLEEFSKIEEYQICIRVYGRMDLLPSDVQQALARMVIETAKFDRFNLNICFAYTSREEITNAMNDLQECVAKHIICPSDINYNTISNALYSLNLSDPDILVRTSGEIRLSDFLLWQSSFSSIYFLKALWPDFNIWHLFSAIIHYQYEYESLKKSRENYFKILKEEDDEFCVKLFDEIHSSKNRFKNGDKIVVENGFSLEEFSKRRKLRIENCQKYIYNKRIHYLEKILETSLNNGSNTILSDHCNNQLIINDKICKNL